MAYTFTLETPALELELKKLIVQETEKDEFDPAEISVRLQGDRMVRKHMMNVRDLAAFIREQHSKI